MSMGLLVDAGRGRWCGAGRCCTAPSSSFLHDVDWGELDYLLVDLPPGHRRRAALAHPADLRGGRGGGDHAVGGALDDAVKAVAMFDKLQVPVLGLIENMSYFVCPNCGPRTPSSPPARRRSARSRWAPVPGGDPDAPRVRLGGDSGRPIVARAARQPRGADRCRDREAAGAAVSIQTLGSAE